MHTRTRTMKYWLAALLVAIVPAASGAQSSPAGKSSVPRTPWGDPDVQGTWDYWTFTPLERPTNLAGKAALTEAEASQQAQRARDQAVGLDAARPRSGDPGAYSQEVWTDRSRPKALTQTSIIVDP